MDWTAVISAAFSALSTGGIVSLLLFYRENKRSRQLDNEHKANAEYQDLLVRHKQREDDLKADVKERDAIIMRKDEKIESLYREKGELMKRNDKLSSTVAALTILRCRVVGCADRVPPMGSRENGRIEEEQALAEK